MADVIRGTVSRLGRTPVADPVVGVLERVLPGRPRRLAILTYHRVDEPDARPDLAPSLLSATPAEFERQMTSVARRYEPVSIGAVLGALERRARLPRRAVLVTFDDGYRDFATNAWPVMRRLGIPATLFVATGATSEPSSRFWWDRLWTAFLAASVPVVETPVGTLELGSVEAARRSLATVRTWLKALDHDAAMHEVGRLVAATEGERPDPASGPSDPAHPAVLTWDELRALAADGVDLAPHTRSHPLLDRVPPDRAVREIADSRDDLEREIGRCVPVLAYPSGAHGGAAVEAARSAGMRAAVTTVRGGNDMRVVDPFRMRRINVGVGTAAPLVLGQLLWATTFG